MVIVKPETVIAWHRKGFRLFWTWKIRHGQPGRPPVSKETRELIRRMSRENPLWDAPRIHGELLKLGIDIGETSVGKYMVRRQKPPSQTWRTFRFGTDQDRLVKHLRLAKVKTMQRANEFLEKDYWPEWNERFAKRPAQAADLHRPLTPQIDLASALSHVESRVIANDYTISFAGRRFQIA